MLIPRDLSYTPQHEWVRITGGVARVGITDYAQDALGDVVFVGVPSVGTTVAADESFTEVESTKSVSDIYAPVAGTITAVNDAPAMNLAPTTGLVGWWQADGNANDVLGANNGTLVNGATFATGRNGQAFSFDGTDDYVQIGASSTFQTQITSSEFSSPLCARSVKRWAMR